MEGFDERPSHEERKRLRREEKNRSHIHDPAPKRWNLGNMWVWHRHLPIDWGVVVCTIILTLVGSLMVLSASSYDMASSGGDSMSEFKTQLQGMLLGGVGFIFASNLDYRWLNQKWIVRFLCLTSLVMLALVVLLPQAGKISSTLNSGALFVRSPYLNGAYRWLRIGTRSTYISIQPSEILKVAVVVYLSYYMTLRQNTMNLFWKNNFGCLLVVGLLDVLLLAQPNLSTASLIAIVTMLMLYAGGMKSSTITILLLIAVVGFYVLARYVIPNRWIRITSFLDPWEDTTKGGSGYQLVQSYYALGNGGWFGTGLGLSKQKHLFLPYAYSDFIFAIVGEELGFVGGVIILGVFLVLIYLGLRIAANAVDRFGTYLALGTTSLIAVQVIFNILVVTGFAPTTGIPLPFFTAGGTTMAIFLTTMGLLVSVSRRPAREKCRLMPILFARRKKKSDGQEA